jgi:hypothetical protein
VSCEQAECFFMPCGNILLVHLIRFLEERTFCNRLPC